MGVNKKDIEKIEFEPKIVNISEVWLRMKAVHLLHAKLPKSSIFHDLLMLTKVPMRPLAWLRGNKNLRKVLLKNLIWTEILDFDFALPIYEFWPDDLVFFCFLMCLKVLPIIEINQDSTFNNVLISGSFSWSNKTFAKQILFSLTHTQTVWHSMLFFAEG